MGSLAMWSGLAGAGKGLAEYSMKRIEDESYEKRSGIDEAREMRIAEFKAQADRENAELQHQYDTSQTMLKAGLDVTGQEAKDASALERTQVSAAAQTQAAAINQAGQSSRFAGEREARRKGEWFDDSARGGASDPRYKAMVDKYKPKTLTVSEASELNPTNPLFNIEKDSPAVYDGTTWYLQVGNKYILPDEEPRYPVERAQAEKDLLERPMELGDEFLATWHYLPIEYFKRRTAQELRLAGYDAYGFPVANKQE